MSSKKTSELLMTKMVKQVPETCASTNSAIRATDILIAGFFLLVNSFCNFFSKIMQKKLFLT